MDDQWFDLVEDPANAIFGGSGEMRDNGTINPKARREKRHLRYDIGSVIGSAL